ncbi:cyclin-dependent kinase F-1 [Tanacetum coccineum]|uniref:Cyclin-dependent kinase F-1 n=1 Tax=Tanacetum coccineum TaxID=301880 RepID=A0ABQ4WY82_9ASTR
MEHPHRPEITSKYTIHYLIGSGTYSDIYKATRISDNLPAALKDVHHLQSAFREIESLQTLNHSPNVVVLLEYFSSDDEDVVLVLEYLILIWRRIIARIVAPAEKEAGTVATATKQEARNTAMEQLTTAS